MEMMVVLGIMAILMAIGITAGSQIFASSKERLTQQTLAALDRSLTEYISVEGRIPEPVYIYAKPKDSGSNPWNSPNDFRWIPVADAVTDEPPYSPHETINSVGWYLKQIEQIESAMEPIRALPEKVFTSVEFHSTDDMEGDNFPQYDEAMPEQSEPHPLPTVLDAWGNPIRYVHPAFQGVIYGNYPNVGGNVASFVPLRDDPTTANVEGVLIIPSSIHDGAGRPPTPVPEAFTDIRRSPTQGDADGGLCTNNRPYFYSCGPDGDPSTVDDNVYLVRPNGFQN